MRKAIHRNFGPLLAAAILALPLVPAGAQDLLPARPPGQHGQAVDAAFADGVTTAVGVAASGGLINPVGALLGMAMKAVTFHRASQLPETEQPEAYAAATAWWQGGTVSNVCMTAVFLTGGGLAPPCLALGAAWGWKTWTDSEHERRFWERCAILRQFARRQTVDCVYVPPGQEAAAAKQVASTNVATKQVAARPAVGKKTKGATPPARPQDAPLPEPPPAPRFGTPHEVEAP